MLAGEVGLSGEPMPAGKIVHARKLSRATMANIWKNLFFSIVFNAAGGSDRGRGSIPMVRSPAEPDHRWCGNSVQFGGGHRQLAALAERSPRVRAFDLMGVTLAYLYAAHVARP